MMIKDMSKKTIFFLILLLVLLSYSAVSIDYSGLSTFSLSMGLDVLKGLSQPDWSFVYDGSGEDLISLLLLTIGIAFLGTAIGTVLAIPFTLLSASNLWKSAPFVSKIGKFVCNVLRAFPELVFAIIFVKVVGPGPFAGVMAIGVHHIGMLGKLYT
ncbi:PhnE/PtxC family ABC transporter permease, partial [Carnobacterium sp.]|uniref:PhnE/PtxC family ABC transporter permease n=1 Tax=Carnobacterium sp. TaxID=48221 RepID=UPI0037BE2392